MACGRLGTYLLEPRAHRLLLRRRLRLHRLEGRLVDLALRPQEHLVLAVQLLARLLRERLERRHHSLLRRLLRPRELGARLVAPLGRLTQRLARRRLQRDALGDQLGEL